uniref:zinc finger protein 853-like n=1 Tax=Semicossyphus pulcher TaxID=241346 RepID=UPI0037E77A12
MEKLVVSAVTEINQLVCEYCAVLRVELSREKQDNSALREQLKLHRPVSSFMPDAQDGNNGAGPELQADQLKRNTVWENVEEPAEEQEERACSSVHYNSGLITVKCENPEDQQKLRASPPVYSATCSEVRECPPHPSGQSSQFCSEPSEANKDLHTGCRPSLEMQCRLSISPSGSQFADLGFHIKREVESPDLQTQGEDVNLGFELQEGFMFQMYTESGAFPGGSTLPDAPAPTCFSSLQPPENQHVPRTLNMPDLSSNRQLTAGREASSHQENQYGRRRTVQYRTPGRFKCDYCGKGFPFLSMMNGHRLTHTGERNQVCGQCGMTFIRRSHLRRHEMLHAGIRPFTCLVCGRNFSRRAHLGSHMKTHCVGTEEVSVFLVS